MGVGVGKPASERSVNVSFEICTFLHAAGGFSIRTQARAVYVKCHVFHHFDCASELRVIFSTDSLQCTISPFHFALESIFRWFAVHVAHTQHTLVEKHICFIRISRFRFIRIFFCSNFYADAKAAKHFWSDPGNVKVRVYSLCMHLQYTFSAVSMPSAFHRMNVIFRRFFRCCCCC